MDYEQQNKCIEKLFKINNQHYKVKKIYEKILKEVKTLDRTLMDDDIRKRYDDLIETDSKDDAV